MSRRSGGAHRRAQGVIPFLPTQLAGCVLWLTPSSLVNSSGAVSQWTDLSGAGNNLTQGTAGKRPTYNASGGPNNYAFAQGVKASNSALQATFTWNQPQETFYVANWYSTQAVGDSLADGTAGNTGRIFFNGAGDIAFLADGAINQLDATGLTLTTWSTYNTQWNGSTSAASVHGTAATQTAGTGLGTGPMAGITLFNFGDATTSPSNSQIAEAIGYSRVLTAGQRAQVLSYLRGKYSIT